MRKKMKTLSLNIIYRKYKQDYFPLLLKDPGINPEDKQKIKELLKKPWNPYIRRALNPMNKNTSILLIVRVLLLLFIINIIESRSTSKY
jgi:hypothetical protein